MYFFIFLADDTIHVLTQCIGDVQSLDCPRPDWAMELWTVRVGGHNDIAMIFTVC